MLNHESLREKRRGQDKAAPTFGAVPTSALLRTLVPPSASLPVNPSPVAGFLRI